MKKFYENLKLFYLGNETDEQKTPLLYKNKHLTTHAAIIGMTGSGKTGLGIGLIEEAALDDIPCIVIDPKGDMGNLLLCFENLDEKEFLPWVNDEKTAKEVSNLWQEGLKNSFQDKTRIKRLKQNTDFTIYTPGSSSGVGISVLSSFSIEPEILNDKEYLNAYISSTVASLLDLIGVKSDFISGKEHILLSTIFFEEFQNSKTLALENLISLIINPKFSKVGVFDLETFFAKDDRVKLAMKLNSLLASKSFESWRVGEELDIDKLLFTKEGKARVSIFTISHLDDSKRMFFVSFLLNKLITWIRLQEGSDALRAIVYMDEIFGFFPPTQNPPSKQPMLTLLKQARAYGISLILSTQNPVDLDYKGLSNIGTWFIGKLQTAQDKEKVIEGLKGVDESNFSKEKLLDIISNLDKRTFLLKNIHDVNLKIFKTRWALSYLKGPLNKEQISTLMSDKKSLIPTKKPAKSTLKTIPIISKNIIQKYCYTIGEAPHNLSAFLVFCAKVRFYDKRRNIDTTKDISLKIPLNEEQSSISFDDSEIFHEILNSKKEQSLYPNLPNFISSLNSLSGYEKDFKDFLYTNEKIEIFTLKELELESNLNESIESFKGKVQAKANEKIEALIDDIMKKSQTTQKRLEERLRKAKLKLEKEKSDVTSTAIDTAISIGSSIIGAFFGRKLLSSTNVSKAATSARRARRVLSEREDVGFAEDEIEHIQDEIDEHIEHIEEEINQIKQKINIDKLQIQTLNITPRKTDIYDIKSFLLWKEF